MEPDHFSFVGSSITNIGKKFNANIQVGVSPQDSSVNRKGLPSMFYVGNLSVINVNICVCLSVFVCVSKYV